MQVSKINSTTSFKAQPLKPQTSAVNTIKKEVKDTISFSSKKLPEVPGAIKSFAGIAAALLAATFLLTSGKDNKNTQNKQLS